MLCQYQLHGGICRLQPRFGQSKRFGTTTTMAASAALTPSNRLPPSVDDFRWWDTIFLNVSHPFTTDETPSVRRQIFLAEPRYGKMHAFLVLVLELPFSCLTTPSNETSLGEKTLKSIHVPPSSTTYFHYFRHNLLWNPFDNKHSQLTHPAPLLRRYRHISHQTPKHPDAGPTNQRTGISHRSSPLPKQRHQLVPQQGLDHRRQDRGHFPPHHPLPIQKIHTEDPVRLILEALGCNRNGNNCDRHQHPLPFPRGLDLVSQKSPKHTRDRPQNQEADLPGRGPSDPQRVKVSKVSRQVWASGGCNRVHCPVNCLFPTNSQPVISSRTDES